MIGIQNFIRFYKRRRDNRYLFETYEKNYAIVGFGNHAINNLFPVIQYLQIHIKYICCSSEKKAKLIGRKFQGIIGTTSIEDILNDKTIAGVFVCATPTSHFNIALQIIQSGKSLFIEKPPCMSLNELNCLIEQQQLHSYCTTMVGMQKRYSPIISKLKKELKNKKVNSYNLRYQTGLYPEGNAIYDLFIHPIDLVFSLFGEGKVLAVKQIRSNNKGGVTYLLILEHFNTVGSLELSTLYSWKDAKESISINTQSGTYNVEQMENLTFSPSYTFGIMPIEKVITNPIKEFFLLRNNFNPVLVNNQIFSQGYFNEIKMFVDMVERKRESNIGTGFISLLATYKILDELHNMI